MGVSAAIRSSPRWALLFLLLAMRLDGTCQDASAATLTTTTTTRAVTDVGRVLLLAEEQEALTATTRELVQGAGGEEGAVSERPGGVTLQSSDAHHHHHQHHHHYQHQRAAAAGTWLARQLPTFDGDKVANSGPLAAAGGGEASSSSSQQQEEDAQTKAEDQRIAEMRAFLRPYFGYVIAGAVAVIAAMLGLALYRRHLARYYQTHPPLPPVDAEGIIANHGKDEGFVIRGAGKGSHGTGGGSTMMDYYRGPCPACDKGNNKSHALVPCSHLVCLECAAKAIKCPICKSTVIAKNWVLSP